MVSATAFLGMSVVILRRLIRSANGNVAMDRCFDHCNGPPHRRSNWCRYLAVHMDPNCSDAHLIAATIHDVIIFWVEAEDYSVRQSTEENDNDG
jgi:hypothetical protein